MLLVILGRSCILGTNESRFAFHTFAKPAADGGPNSCSNPLQKRSSDAMSVMLIFFLDQPAPPFLRIFMFASKRRKKSLLPLLGSFTCFIRLVCAEGDGQIFMLAAGRGHHVEELVAGLLLLLLVSLSFAAFVLLKRVVSFFFPFLSLSCFACESNLFSSMGLYVMVTMFYCVSSAQFVCLMLFVLFSFFSAFRFPFLCCCCHGAVLLHVDQVLYKYYLFRNGFRGGRTQYKPKQLPSSSVRYWIYIESVYFLAIYLPAFFANYLNR